MTVDAAITLVLSLIEHSQQISNLIVQARQNGQTTLPDEDLKAIRASANKAREALVAAIG